MISEVLPGVREERHFIHTVKKRRKAKWLGHVLYRNCLLKHVIELKIEKEGRPNGLVTFCIGTAF